jgi:hypothetical protein
MSEVLASTAAARLLPHTAVHHGLVTKTKGLIRPSRTPVA